MNLNKIKKYLSTFISSKPRVCIILGSGLEHIENYIENRISIPYNSIPNFYKTTVKGHKGEFIYGNINNISLLCAKGRFHYYEGYTFKEVGSLIEIFNSFNPELCIITNSSDCLVKSWPIGSLMLSNKIIDYSFIDSIKHKEYVFKKNKYICLAKYIAKKNKIKLFEGSYVFTTGPSYETPAEIHEIIKLGGNAVGMSTFPEYLKCIKLNLNFLIISCLTNYGSGMKNSKVSHEDVLLNANKFKNNFSDYILGIIQNIELQKIQMK